MALLRRLVFAALLSFILTAIFSPDSQPAWSIIAGGRAATRGSPYGRSLVPHGGHALEAEANSTPTVSVMPRPQPSPLPTRPTPATLTSSTTVLAYPPPPIAAKAAILVDLESGRVLFEQNADARLPMASTTKITTAAVVLQHARLNDLVRVSENAATIGESTMSLARGERLTVRQLLYGMLLNSGNDAAVALAEHVGGSESRFVGMMNELAASLHLRNTHYATPHGLDAPHHYTSARDLATIAAYALRSPIFRQIVDTANYYVPGTRHNHVHWLANVNNILFWYPGVNGVKPGDTDDAGFCQVVSVDRDGRRLLAVLLDTPTMVFDARNLLDYGLHDFRWVQAPAYWDYPANNASGGSGIRKWIYYYGSGHFIRGLYYAYFHSHGGLDTFGYPLTEVISQAGQEVQYFQAGELVYDPSHNTVYPQPLGAREQALLVPRAGALFSRVAAPFAALYKRLGGANVLGYPLGHMIWVGGHFVQFYQYGELGLVGGIPYEVPVGSVALRLKGWLPAIGAPDVLPLSMSPFLMALHPAP